MGILNQPSDGMPSVLVVLHRTLCSIGPLPKDELFSLVAPQSLIEDRKHVVDTLNTWSKLGLFHESEGVVRVMVEGELRRVARQLVCQNKEEGAADFNLAYAWVCSQNLLGLPTAAKTLEALEIEQLETKEKRVFSNDVRIGGFLAWSTFLELAFDTKGGYFFDPTTCVLDLIQRHDLGQKTLSIDDFLDLVSRQVPFLDGGAFQKQVQDRLGPIRFHESDEISFALSHSLRRLSQSGVVKIDALADAKRSFYLNPRQMNQRCSHLFFGEVA